MAELSFLNFATERVAPSIVNEVGRSVVVCFLDARSSAVQEHCLNAIAEKIAPKSSGPPKIHCEILFPEDDASYDTGYSCSITYNGRVFLKPKRFSREDWSFRVLSRVPNATWARMRTFCQGCVGDYFNHIGYALYGLTSGVVRVDGSWTTNYRPMTRRWFCSEIVIEALKIGNYLPLDLSSVQHPETLFQLLRPHSSAGTAKSLASLNVV
jgi:hypothetical protein